MSNIKKNIIKVLLKSIKDICNTEILIDEINKYVDKISKCSEQLINKQIQIENLTTIEKDHDEVIEHDQEIKIVEKYIIKSVLWEKSHTIDIDGKKYISLNIVITIMFNSMIKYSNEKYVTNFIKKCFANKEIENKILSIKNKFKRNQLYIMSNYDNDVMSFMFNVKPMIYKPKEWEIDYGKKTEVNIVNGGLLSIKKKLIAGDENNSISCYHQFNNSYLNYINRSQEMSIKYDIESLSEILHIIKEMDYNIIPFNRDTNNIIINKDHNKYINKLIEENNPKDEIWRNNIKNYKKNMIKKIINEDISNIRNYINNLSLIIILIKITKESIIKCYYKKKIDHRLRESTDGSLSYVYSKFLRPFTFVDTNFKYLDKIGDKYLRYFLTFKVKKIISINEIMSWEEIMSTNLDNCINKFEFMSFIYMHEKKNTNMTINLDACQSMLQIYGCIISNENILTICNAINKKEKIIDAYDYILKIKDFDDIKNYYIKYILYYIINKRKIKKKIIMEYLYGSTAYEISRKIIKEEKWINHNHILLAINIIIKKKLKVIFKDIIIMNNFLKIYVDACSNEYYNKIIDKKINKKKEVDVILDYLKNNNLLDKIKFKDWDNNEIIYSEREKKKKNILKKKKKKKKIYW